MNDTVTIAATQYLTYKLGEETFALDISKVREVLDYTAVTRVPRTPDFMRGVINLRGTVVPVVDLKLKFGMPMTEKSVNACIIIAEMEADSEAMVIGALADSVQEVMDLEAENISALPKIGTSLSVDFIKGMGRHNDRFIIILDIDRVFSGAELAQVQAVQEETISATA